MFEGGVVVQVLGLVGQVGDGLADLLAVLGRQIVVFDGLGEDGGDVGVAAVQDGQLAGR